MAHLARPGFKAIPCATRTCVGIHFRRKKRQVPLGRQVSAIFVRNNLLTFPSRRSFPHLGRECARKEGAGLFLTLPLLFIKTHRPTLTVMLARKCSFPKLHRYIRVMLSVGAFTYVRIFMAVPQFSADFAAHVVRGTVALHLSFSRGGEITRRNGSE